MPGRTAIGVRQQLPACQAAVAGGAADDKPSRWIYI